MECREWTIGECRADDVATLGEWLPSPTGRPDIHGERFLSQEQGHCVYLVARIDGVPVGHAVLEWAGCLAPEVYADFIGVPEICSLLVLEDLRGLGIGTTLIDEAAQRAAARERHRIGIGVAAANRRAAGLYQRLGFRTVRSYLNRWSVMDDDGHSRQVTEPTTYLVKDV